MAPNEQKKLTIEELAKTINEVQMEEVQQMKPEIEKAFQRLRRELQSLEMAILTLSERLQLVLKPTSSNDSENKEKINLEEKPISPLRNEIEGVIQTIVKFEKGITDLLKRLEI